MNRSQALLRGFKQAVSVNAVTISDASYQRYILQAHSGPVVDPIFEGEGRAGIESTPRDVWAVSNVNERYVSDAQFPYPAAGDDLKKIGQAESCPVWFSEMAGVYYLHDPDTKLLFEVWLTWPAYPCETQHT